MSNQQQELINTIKEIAKDKKISEEFVIEAFKSAIVSEYTHEFIDSKIEVEFENNEFKLYRLYTVVDDVNEEEFDDYIEINISEARKINPNVTIGDTVRKPVEFINLSKKLIQNI
jgi:N utilization substance protein A